MAEQNMMDKVVSLCKRRGFIFPGSDIYGGLANTWDYGPYGVELKNNIKRAWWKANVHERNDMYGMDAAILMHTKVWEASGHVENFYDLKRDCKACKKRFKTADLSSDACPSCGGELTEARPFNLMFKTYQGPVEEAGNQIYMRPETAQGIFVNFQNVIESRHPKLPFGIAQIGKSFRNEITPGNFTFRTREFEQMEIEYFVRPEEAETAYNLWVSERHSWYLRLGLRAGNVRLRQHGKDELAHYAAGCTDVEYQFPFGWSELEGIANRTDFDLKRHAEHSGKDLRFLDDIKKERFFPYIIEPSGGVDRGLLAFLVDAYTEETVKDDIRVVLKLHPELAPVKAAVLPLLKNRPELVEKAKKLSAGLKKCFNAVYDDTAAIGKLYRRQDEVGTLFCVTVDVQSLEDNQVTVRDRDTMKQDRISIDQVKRYIQDKMEGCSTL